MNEIIDLDEVWKQYPNPMTVYDGEGKTDYCVGGALCQYCKVDIHNEYNKRFPDNETLERLLLRLNPNLTESSVRSFVIEIIVNNDSRKFDKARNLIADALNYKGTENG